MPDRTVVAPARRFAPTVRTSGATRDAATPTMAERGSDTYVEFKLADLFECVADARADRVAAVVRLAHASTYAELDERSTRLAHVLDRHGVVVGDHVGCYQQELDRAPRGDARLLQGARGPDQREHPLRRRRARVLARRRRRSSRLLYDADGRDRGDASAALRRSGIAARRRRSRATTRGSRRPRPHATSGPAPPTTTTCCTPAARPACRRAWCGATRTSSSRHSAAGIPAAHRSRDAGGDPRRRCVDNPRNACGRSSPPASRHPSSSSRSRSVRSCTRAGSGRHSARCSAAGRSCCTTSPHVDMAHVLELVERERVNAMNFVGDASARPLLDELARSIPDAGIRRRCASSDRAAASLSGATSRTRCSRDACPSVARDRRRHRLVGVAGAGGRGDHAATARSPGASLTFAAKAETMVVDDDLRPVPRGSGIVGRLATRGRVPIGYYKDPDRSARTFVEIDGQRWSLPGDMATIDGDGTVAPARARLAVHQHGRREGVSRRGRGRVEDARRPIADAVVVGAPDEQWGQRVAAVVAPVSPDAPPDLETLQAHCRGRRSPATRCRAGCMSSTRSNARAAGKLDYAWARAVVTSA